MTTRPGPAPRGPGLRLGRAALTPVVTRDRGGLATLPAEPHGPRRGRASVAPSRVIRLTVAAACAPRTVWACRASAREDQSAPYGERLLLLSEAHALERRADRTAREDGRPRGSWSRWCAHRAGSARGRFVGAGRARTADRRGSAIGRGPTHGGEATPLLGERSLSSGRGRPRLSAQRSRFRSAAASGTDRLPRSLCSLAPRAAPGSCGRGARVTGFEGDSSRPSAPGWQRPVGGDRLCWQKSPGESAEGVVPSWTADHGRLRRWPHQPLGRGPTARALR